MDRGVFSGDVFVRNVIEPCPIFSVNDITAKGDNMPKTKPEPWWFHYRCRNCRKEFTLPPSPNRDVLVRCKKCGSTDVELM